MSERFLDKVFQAFEDVAVQQEQSAPIVPADGDDYTYTPQTVKNLLAAALGLDESLIPDTAYRHQFSYERQPDGTWQYRRTSNGETVVVPIGNTDEPLTYAALVKTVYRLQNEMAGLAAQVVELRERMDRNEADS